MDGWKEWKEKIPVEDGYAVMMFTDRFVADGYPLSPENEELLSACLKEKLLDLRVFDSGCEFRMFRGDAGKEFRFRIARDEGQDFYDDEQYLDIDDRKSRKSFSQDHRVWSTSGGSYCLPYETYHDAKVLIRNYVAYGEETGRAYIRDWRLLGFTHEEGEDRE